ncbi:MAG: P-loop NTPase fold protein, partial [Sciscionella sp.]
MAFAPDGSQLASGSDDGTIRIWNPRNGVQVDGTGFGVARRAGRPLAGVRSDSPSPEDGLGVSADVETLADLIAAMDTRPPLAIALIGDWGAGKSSVMLQVQRRVDVLAEMSRNNPGLSVFASSVRQVRFNAWHYSDEHVWAGLVTQLFRTLSADHEDAEEATASQRHDAAADRDRLRSELAQRETEQRRLSAALEAVERSSTPRGSLAGLGSLAGAGRVVRATIRELRHDVRASAAVVAGWVVLAAAAYVMWRWFGPLIGVTTTAVAALAAPFVAVWRGLARWHRSGMGFVRRRRDALEARTRAVQHEVTQLRERLALIDAAARLEGFLKDRGAASAYQRYRGLLGQVHTDLTALSEDLRQAHRDWVAAGSTTPPPLERIVLYVDDLDRCPPQR